MVENLQCITAMLSQFFHWEESVLRTVVIHQAETWDWQCLASALLTLLCVVLGHAQDVLARVIFQAFVKEGSLSKYCGMEQVQKSHRDDSVRNHQTDQGSLGYERGVCGRMTTVPQGCSWYVVVSCPLRKVSPLWCMFPMGRSPLEGAPLGAKCVLSPATSPTAPATLLALAEPWRLQGSRSFMATPHTRLHSCGSGSNPVSLHPIAYISLVRLWPAGALPGSCGSLGARAGRLFLSMYHTWYTCCHTGFEAKFNGLDAGWHALVPDNAPRYVYFVRPDIDRYNPLPNTYFTLLWKWLHWQKKDDILLVKILFK